MQDKEEYPDPFTIKRIEAVAQTIRTQTNRLSSLEPATSLRGITVIRHHLERLERLQVAHARKFGWSWSSIGEVLGVRKQAVYAKHNPKRERHGTPRATRAFTNRHLRDWW